MKPAPSLRPPTSLADFIRLGPDAALDWMRAGGRRDLRLLEQAHIVLVLMRPRPCLVGLLAYALGAAYTGADLSLRVALSALLCYCSGLLANLENAYTDLEEDYRNLPGRVFLLTGIGLPRFRVLLVSFNLVMLILAATLDVYCFAFMCVGLLLVHQYSFPPLRAKSRPVVGILVFSSITIYTFSVGALAEPGAPFLHAIVDYLTGSSMSTLVERVPRFLAMAVFLFLWFSANALFKNIADFNGDQEVELRTSATVFSNPKRAAVACLCLSVASYGSLVIPVFAGLGKADRSLGPAVVHSSIRGYRHPCACRRQPHQGEPLSQDQQLDLVGFSSHGASSCCSGSVDVYRDCGHVSHSGSDRLARHRLASRHGPVNARAKEYRSQSR